MKCMVGRRIESYHILLELGRGAFGNVYQAKDSVTGTRVAVKFMQKQRLIKINPILLQYARSQIKILQQCKGDPNVLELIKGIQTDEEFIIITQYCNEGELDKYIEKNIKIPEDKATMFLNHILNGFKKLHQNKTMHRDFKTQNLLLHNGVCKIADLGLSKRFEHQQIMTSSIVGTQDTMAPQVMRGKGYDFSADIWSIGIVYYTMLYCHGPYTSLQLTKIRERAKYQYKYIQPIFQEVNISEQAKDFIKKCLQPDPKMRIKWSQIYQHPLIKVKISLSSIYEWIAKIVDLENDKRFYEELQQNISTIKPISEQEFSNNQIQNCSFAEETIEPAVFDQLIKENNLRKQKDSLFARYQQMYNSEIKNILFFFRFIFPYVHKFENLNLNHTITMLILIKEVYCNFKDLCLKLDCKKNFKQLPMDDFNQFSQTSFYTDLCLRCGYDIIQISYQMQSYKNDLKPQLEQQSSEFFDFYTKLQLKYPTFLTSQYIGVKKESIQTYWFILAENLKEATTEKSKQYLIRVIKALQYLKSTNKVGSDEFGILISEMDFVSAERQILREWEQKIESIQIQE